MIKGRLLGLDFGSKTLGVAISDELQITARALKTITRKKENKLRTTLSEVVNIVTQYNIQTIVLGIPYNVDGSSGWRVDKTMEFKDLLSNRLSNQNIDVPIFLIDECLTTVEADQILGEKGIYGKEAKKYNDSLAAVIMLEDYIKNN